jgi:protein-L-isoaspartate(D-aspartate) O-methyltransferase
MKDLAAARWRFARALLRQERISSARLLRAFATVPRERFLGAGPWRLRSIVPDYWSTVDADPIHLYEDVLVAIDEDRGLDNGLPSLWARLFEVLDIKEKECVVQVGCGTGYYSAILSQMVGPAGKIIAIDREEAFVRRARWNLRAHRNVEVIHGDGCQVMGVPADAIIAHAGFTRPHRAWLDALRLDGRLLVPMTSRDRQGTLFKITRLDTGYCAKAVGPIQIVPGHGRANIVKDRRLARWWEAMTQVRSLRRDRHARDHTCWLHADGSCLSSLPLSRRPVKEDSLVRRG